MSLREILGPLILDLAGTELLPEEAEVLLHPQVGGIIFFRRNYESPEQLSQLVNQVRSIRPNLLLGVDQEGGRVQRFKDGFTRLPPLQKYGDLYLSQPAQAIQLVQQGGWLMAAELIVAGLDVSFAPVVDVDDAYSAVIGDRSFSADIDVVTRLASAFIDGMLEAGMSATLKHFPGHGSVEEDSHFESPVDERSYEEVFAEDMRPFRDLLGRAGAVMPAHILFPSIDPNPVGFSPFWLETVLRQKLQFNGIIFSDDLSMEAASVAGDHSGRAMAALHAGCDAILVCNEPAQAIKVLDQLNAFQHLGNRRLSMLAADRNKLPTTLGDLKKMDKWQLAANNILQFCDQ